MKSIGMKSIEMGLDDVGDLWYVKPIIRKEVKAYCYSADCCGVHKNKTVKDRPKLKKVLKTTTWCPDCKHALMWV